MDRNQLEQEALRQINLGSQEGALRAYLQILRFDPRDRRIRQKVGEIYLKLGRPADAERQLREVAEGLVKEGSHRAAVAVLKQILTIKPDDPGLQFDLAECYVASGYPNDARPHFDTAMRLWIGLGKAMDAAKAAHRVAELAPGEPALRLKAAELYEAAGDTARAGAAYVAVAEEYRRRGRPDEVGRVAEMALRVRPDDLGLLLDAAAARVEAGEHKRALVHLQTAFTQGAKEPRTLDLLARAFEGVGQSDRALKVLGELARLAADRNEPAAEADALRRAVRLAPDDAELQARLTEAEDRVTRRQRRLTQLSLGQPTDEAELRAQVRAEVYARYGFVDRAESTIREALAAAPASVPLRASLAELLVDRGSLADAFAILRALLPEAGAEANLVAERLQLLGGDVPATAAGADEGPEARGDRLSAAGDLPGAMMAWREALAAAPSDDRILAKIGSLRERLRLPAPAPEPDPPARSEEDDEAAFADFAPLDDGTFSEVDPDALDAVEPLADLDEARSLVAVGMWDDALALLGGADSLEAAVLRAQAIRGQGDVAGALDALRDAVNDALESDPAYCDALFELSALYTATGKARAAVRLLEELKDLDGSFRAAEVDARMRGLQKLLK